MTEKTTSETINDLKIAQAYLEFFAAHGHPVHVREFCEFAEIDIELFHTFFDNLAAIKPVIWRYFFLETYQVLINDPAYANFTVQEKLLSFYYTHLEVLSLYRGYILDENQAWYDPFPANMKVYRQSFKEYVKQLILEAIENKEIADRKFLADVYVEGFWIQLLFVLRFWMQDQSPDQEHTDGAIEKAVHLSFEIISCGPFEAFIDFAKYIIQHKS